MLGALAGDLIGSRFEHHNTDRFDFALFGEDSHLTDDTDSLRAAGTVAVGAGSAGASGGSGRKLAALRGRS